jgi:hypothetical protein
MVWVVLAGVVGLLALYRKLLSDGHYNVLHLRRSELPLVPREMAYGWRLDRIDRWGKILTWVASIYGFALLLYYLYLYGPPAS